MKSPCNQMQGDFIPKKISLIQIHGEIAHDSPGDNRESMGLFDFLDDFCYFEIMQNEQIEKAKRHLQTGGIAAAIIAILITLFLHFLYKYTFICLDPEICERIKEPMLQISP